MVAFTVWTQVEEVGAGRFIARALAIPVGVGERCAPEERCRECASEREAQLGAERLARALAADVLARGNWVLPADGPAPAFAARHAAAPSQPLVSENA